MRTKKNIEVFRDTLFFVLGGQKCGTTTLYQHLDRHPEIYMSDRKEPFFFEDQYTLGIDYYLDRYYGEWNGEVAGEARPVNLYLPYVPERIKNITPNARFLIVLRHPVERAHSDWWMYRSTGPERSPFHLAVKKNMQRIRNGNDFSGEEGVKRWSERLHTWNLDGYRTYVDKGYYDEQLQRYFDRFDRDQFRIYLFEQFINNTEDIMKEIFSFLGVDDSVELQEQKSQNPALPGFVSYVTHWFPIEELNPYISDIPEPIKLRIKNLLASFGGGRPEIKSTTKKFLEQHYRPHINKLKQLVDLDFSLWDRNELEA